MAEVCTGTAKEEQGNELLKGHIAPFSIRIDRMHNNSL